MDARLSGAALPKVLSDIGTLTGWEVMVEPGMGRRVSTGFSRLTLNQGLRRILGDLNFALLRGDDDRRKLFVYRRSINAATEVLQSQEEVPSGKSRRIENEIIVTLEPDSPETIEEIAARLGAEVVGKIEGAKNAYRLRFKDAAGAEAARQELASVDYLDVADNYEVDIPARLASLNFGGTSTPRIRATSNPDHEQVVIGLVDTSVQIADEGMSEFLLPTLSVAGEANPPLDEPTHGTTMAETMVRGLQMVEGGTAGAMFAFCRSMSMVQVR